MRPLYDTRLADLGPGDLVEAECVCGHAELLTAELLRMAGVPEHQKIEELPAYMRCQECDERGKVVVSVKWGNGERSLGN